MAILLLKTIICSLVLLLCYQWFLAKERTFIFNRFFLLTSLIFAHAVPFLKIPVAQRVVNNDAITFGNSTGSILENEVGATQSIELLQILFGIWFIVAILLFIKSIVNLTRINNLKGKIIFYNGVRIKVLEDDLPPFSFFKTFYVGKDYFKNNKIDERIFIHEKTHIQQRHSWDLLLIEVLSIVFWFNPILYFYRKAIITNHEFLADEQVVSNDYDIKNYQRLILSEISDLPKKHFTHQFNFYNTKKRFIMMTTKQSKYAGIKKIISVPAFVMLFVLFVQKVNANPVITPAPKSMEKKDKQPMKDQGVQPKPVGKTIINEVPVETPKKEVEKNEIIHEMVETTKTSVPPISESSVLAVEEMRPEFPGGISVFREKIGKEMDTSKFGSATGLIKTVINFIIDENGHAKDFTVEGDTALFNAEALRTVQKIAESETWKPATKDGKPVKFYFKLPLTMQFENAPSGENTSVKK